MKRGSMCIGAALLFTFGLLGAGCSRRSGTPPAESAKPAKPATVVTVVMGWPGVSPSVVDASLATPLAAALNDLPAVKRVEVSSTLGRCTAVIRFGPDVEPPAAMQAVRQRVAGMAGKLPGDCSGAPQILGAEPDSLPRIWVILQSQSFNLANITDLARRLVRDPVARLPGVRDAQLIGGVDEVQTVRFDPIRLNSFGWTFGDAKRAVADALKAMDNPQHNSPALDSRALGDVVIATRNGLPIRAGDIAGIALEGRPAGFATADGNRVLLLVISAAPDEPTTRAVEQELTRLAATLPPDVHMDLAADLSRDRAFLIEGNVSADSSLQRVRRSADDVTRVLHGGAPKSVCITFSSGQAATFHALLTPADPQLNAADFRKRLDKIEGVCARVGEIGAGGLSPFPVRVALVGPDPAVLKRWAEAWTARVKTDGAAVDVDVFPRAEGLSAQLVVDRATAARLGVTMAEIDDALHDASGGATVSGPGGQTVDVRLSTERLSRPDLLRWLCIRIAGDKLIPLSAVAHYEATNEPSGIFRIGSSPAVRLTATPPPGTAPAAATANCLAAATAEREKLTLSSEYQAIDLLAPPTVPAAK